MELDIFSWISWESCIALNFFRTAGCVHCTWTPKFTNLCLDFHGIILWWLSCLGICKLRRCPKQISLEPLIIFSPRLLTLCHRSLLADTLQNSWHSLIYFSLYINWPSQWLVTWLPKTNHCFLEYCRLQRRNFCRPGAFKG